MKNGMDMDIDSPSRHQPTSPQSMGCRDRTGTARESFRSRLELQRRCFFSPDETSGVDASLPVPHSIPSLIPHWFTLFILGSQQTPLYNIHVALLDYTFLPPSSHPVRQILPWHGVLARRELSLAWFVYLPHLPKPSPAGWMRRHLELDATLEPYPWEVMPLLNWMIDESIREHPHLNRLSELEVSRQIQPSTLAWPHPDGRFFVFAGNVWLSICPETWFLQEYCECLSSAPNTPAFNRTFILQPFTGLEICLRPLLGHAFCPFPSLWDTTGFWSGKDAS